MEANASKFQVMVSGYSDENFKIDNVEIQSVNSVKLLGIHLDENMDFNNHISHIARKATGQLNCLKRIAYGLQIPVKLLLYKSFVMSYFSYCPVVWHHCGSGNTKKLEKIQFRALKFVYQDYVSDYEVLLKKANIPTLELGRLRKIAIEVYKCFNNTSPSFLSSKFRTRPAVYNLRSTSSVQTYHQRTTRNGLHSFAHSGATLWNSLPAALRTATDFKTFKNLIHTWTGPACKCTYCRQL